MSDKYDWLVQIPINEGKAEAWANSRADHLSHLKPYISDGTIVFGGPIIEKHTTGEEMKVRSSVMIFRASTENEVHDIVRQNPFVEVGIWDMERTVVTPIRCTIRRPLD